MSQTYFNVVALVVSFIGGGVISALINWARVQSADRKERRIRFLNDQIRNLYGPLHYYVSQSEKLFEITDRFGKAYDEEFVKKEWSSAEFVRKTLDKETKVTIDIQNEYIHVVEQNNIKIQEILDSNYALIDPSDIDILLRFFEDHIRLRIERDSDRKTRTPHVIYEQVGDISFLCPEVIERIKERFLSKKKELDCLLKK